MGVCTEGKVSSKGWSFLETWCQWSQLHLTRVTCLKGSQLWASRDNRQRLFNGAGCFTTVKTVGRIYSLQLVVAALLPISQSMHINPFSSSGPTNRIYFPNLVSNNLRGATGSSGFLCWYPTPRTSWMASAPTSSTCTTANSSTTRWVDGAPCDQRAETGAVLWTRLMFHALFPGKLWSVCKDSLRTRRKSNEAIPLGARSDCSYEGTCLAAWAPSYPLSRHPCPSSALSLWLLANSFCRITLHDLAMVVRSWPGKLRARRRPFKKWWLLAWQRELWMIR